LRKVTEVLKTESTELFLNRTTKMRQPEFSGGLHFVSGSLTSTSLCYTVKMPVYSRSITRIKTLSCHSILAGLGQ